MQGQGLWLVGEFDGTSSRTVSPKEGGKNFEPFKVETVAVIVNEDLRRVEYREGKMPDFSKIKLGDVIVLGVRFDGVFNGQPQWAGRSVAPVAALSL